MASAARLPLAVAALALVLAGGGCGGDGETEAGQTTAPPPTASASPDGCEVVAPPQPDQRTAPKPQRKLAASKTYELIFDTTCGSFTVELDLEAAPNAAASLVSLARRGYFDGTQFHRIVPGFVIQGGDPTATGAGGPGYSTVDAPPPGTVYTKGVVAMAKTALEAPGTAGSQFFVVTAEDAGLPPEYAVVGEVVGGLDAVERIGELGDASEQPTRPVVIRRVRVRTGASG